MIYGVEAQNEEKGAPIVPYAASGVQFNSACLTNASISCTDNNVFSFAGWFKTDWPGNNSGPAFIIDPSGDYNSGYLSYIFNGVEFAIAPPATSVSGGDLYSPDINGTTWMHLIGSIDNSSSTIVVYVNDVAIVWGVNSFKVGFSGGAFSITCNGKPLWIGYDYYNFFTGAMADVSIWPGTSFLTAGDIDVTTRRLFIDAFGNAVDPSVTVAALGAPVAMLAGNSSNFYLNSLGTAGVFTLAAGTLTDVAGP